jgi:dephospho-CoA kinase
VKVIGISGTIGSGKNEVKEIIKQRFNCYCVTLSDVIKAEIEKKRGLLDRKTLQDMGNEMRKKYGPHILAMLAVEYLPRDKEIIIVDGIRNPAEGEYLRKRFGNNFIWIGVDAPLEIRFKRATERRQHNDPKSFEEFVKLDARDQGLNEPEYGQQTKKCLEKCDVLIFNDGSLEDLKLKVNNFIDKMNLLS